MSALSPLLATGLLACLLPFCDAHAAPGDLDPGFNFGLQLDGWVNAFAIQNDGKIIVGTFAPDDVEKRMVVRLLEDGRPDNAFKPITFSRESGPAGPASIILQPDRKIVVVGNFTSVDGVARSGVVRLETDGSLDSDFNPQIDLGSSGSVGSIVIQSDGKILLAGKINEYQPDWYQALVRLDSNGTLDSSFIPNGGDPFDSWILAVASEPDGKVLVGGLFQSVYGEARHGIARLNSDGTLDMSFGNARVGGAFPHVLCILAQPDGQVLIGGEFTSVGGRSRRGIARLNVSGSLDTNFNPGIGVNFANPTSGWDGRGVRSLALQSDEKVLVAGQFEQFDGVSRTNMVRLNPDGTVDTGFNPSVRWSRPHWLFSRVVLQPDGKVLAAGLSGPPHLVRLFGGDQLPGLRISRSGRSLVVSWPTVNSANTLLEAAGLISADAEWLPVNSTPALVGDLHVVTIEAEQHARFFRLRRD